MIWPSHCARSSKRPISTLAAGWARCCSMPGSCAKPGCTCGRWATRRRWPRPWPRPLPTTRTCKTSIEIALHEGVAPALGYQLVLENYGTCNAITTFEGALTMRPRADQQEAAGLLLRHLHAELLANVRADIARQSGKEPSETTLAGLVADRDWLFADNNYHVDTTHLAATIRFARLLEEPELLELAYDLTEYGRRLSSQFQFAGRSAVQRRLPEPRAVFRGPIGPPGRRGAGLLPPGGRGGRPARARHGGGRSLRGPVGPAAALRRGDRGRDFLIAAGRPHQRLCTQLVRAGAAGGQLRAACRSLPPAGRSGGLRGRPGRTRRGPVAGLSGRWATGLAGAQGFSREVQLAGPGAHPLRP